MQTLTLIVAGHIVRWSGGSFIAAWVPERVDEHVPDHMIPLPSSVVRSRATADDIARIANQYFLES